MQNTFKSSLLIHIIFLVFKYAYNKSEKGRVVTCEEEAYVSVMRVCVIIRQQTGQYVYTVQTQ